MEKGTIIADGAATFNGELALGATCWSRFMTWDGYNFEDAIVISEELVKDDVYTSIHIEEFDIEIRETKLGREEFTRDIPNVSEKALRNLDETGIVRIGTYVRPGDILVGKVAPKSKTELTPEEKLLHAIFGRAGEDVKNDSLEVPSGVEGVVIDTEKFSPPHAHDRKTKQEVRKGLEERRRTKATQKSPKRSLPWRPRSKAFSERPLTDAEGTPMVRRSGTQVRCRTGADVQAGCDRYSQPGTQRRSGKGA